MHGSRHSLAVLAHAWLAAVHPFAPGRRGAAAYTGHVRSEGGQHHGQAGSSGAGGHGTPHCASDSACAKRKKSSCLAVPELPALAAAEQLPPGARRTRCAAMSSAVLQGMHANAQRSSTCLVTHPPEGT